MDVFELCIPNFETKDIKKLTDNIFLLFKLFLLTVHKRFIFQTC